MLKLIYLDIDGVLSSQDNADRLFLDFCFRNNINNDDYISKSMYESFKDGVYKDQYGVLFDERCVGWLKYIIDLTGASIVISSDWKKMGLEKLKQMWADRNLPGDVVDIIPVVEKKHFSESLEDNRARSIEQHIRETSPTKWAVIDDMDLLTLNFVNVNPEYGINRLNALKTINFLKNE